MPLLSALAAAGSCARRRPFDGVIIAACLHVTAETAVLVRALRPGGALVRLAASNPLSTQDDIRPRRSRPATGWRSSPRTGVDRDTYYEHIGALKRSAATQPAAQATPTAPDSASTTAATVVSTLQHASAAA